MPTITQDPPWLRAARADLGQRETLGPNDSPWIRRMLAKLAGAWLLGQPWCGGAVATWMQAAQLPMPKAWYRAKAWLDWGTPIAAPAVGAVVVFAREGGGHVGLVVGRDQLGRLLVLGGNQANAVTIAPFDPVRVIGYRWPSERLALLRQGPLPVTVAAGPASSHEA